MNEYVETVVECVHSVEFTLCLTGLFQDISVFVYTLFYLSVGAGAGPSCSERRGKPWTSNRAYLGIWGFGALLKATLTMSRMCPISSPATFQVDHPTSQPSPLETELPLPHWILGILIQHFNFSLHKRNNKGHLNCQ